jgi:DNA/RNA endonuclease YhcR with UshA esterase domain
MKRTLLLPLLLIAPACAAAQTPSPRLPVSSVAAARAGGPGAVVLLEGIVTVAPGTFDGGFAVQDGTGGVWVLPPADPIRLPVGSRVRLQGTLDTPNEQLSLQPAGILVLGTGEPPEPRDVATGGVAEVEGWLVRVSGRIVAGPLPDAPWGWTLSLDDGSGAVTVFLDAETDVVAGTLSTGDPVEVVGFAGRYEDRHEVLPRTSADLRRLPL